MSLLSTDDDAEVGNKKKAVGDDGEKSDHGEGDDVAEDRDEGIEYSEEFEEEEEETDAKNPDTADKEQTVPSPVNGFDEAVDDLVTRMRDRVVLNETDDQG